MGNNKILYKRDIGPFIILIGHENRRIKSIYLRFYRFSETSQEMSRSLTNVLLETDRESSLKEKRR